MTGLEIGGENAQPINVDLGGTATPLAMAIGGSGTALAASVDVGGSGTPLVASVDVGGSGTPLVAQVGVGGTATPLAASVGVGGSGTPLVASVGVSADLKSIPDIGVRLKEIPTFEIQAPIHLKLGFSIFGIELFAISLGGEGKLRSV
jgi:hypothetical protein